MVPIAHCVTNCFAKAHSSLSVQRFAGQFMKYSMWTQLSSMPEKRLQRRCESAPPPNDICLIDCILCCATDSHFL